MTDIKSPEERSRNMSQIHNKDTKPEIAFRHMLFARGYRYRKNVNYVPGHPDLYLAKYNTVIFIHGCFWHRHKGCKYAYTPKTRTEFWESKFAGNVQRDENVRQLIRRKNLKCLIVWECTVKKMLRDEVYAAGIMEKVQVFLSNTEYFEEL